MTADVHSPSRIQALRERLATPQAIYGTLLVSAIIGSASDEDPDRLVLELALRTTIVFWIAHVFADGLAHYGRGGDGMSASASLRYGLRHGAGLLYAGIIPCLCLLLGALGLLEEYFAYYLALAIPVVLLGSLGWVTLANRGSSWPVRLAGAAVTALLGIVVILIKIIGQGSH
ncbi:MAG: hypothetical protein JWO10_293 [Microbacteriaceae bacterium]|nr:hypothetical protein [Microbacteriaceae bacterium]